jgi:SEC-C motif-containing protein
LGNEPRLLFAPYHIKIMAKPLSCPCRKLEKPHRLYSLCCGVWHQNFLRGGEGAPSPELLMRSRYSAFALATKDDLKSRNLLRYLKATWHPDHRPTSISLTECQFVGLEILEAPLPTEQSGSVSYAVFIQHGPRVVRTDYHDRFDRLDGRWVYFNGDMMEPPSPEKIL